MTIDQEKLLFSRIKLGDKAAFDAFFNKYYVRLCRFAFTYTKSRDLAEETVQNTFVKIWCQRSEINISTSVVSYLFTAVKNQAINELRKEIVRKGHESEYADHCGIEKDGFATINAEKFKKVILVAVDRLPEKCREIFKLCKNEGLTYDEISEYLRISEKTVENQMGIALKKLRKILRPDLKQLLE